MNILNDLKSQNFNVSQYIESIIVSGDIDESNQKTAKYFIYHWDGVAELYQAFHNSKELKNRVKVDCSEKIQKYFKAVRLLYKMYVCSEEYNEQYAKKLAESNSEIAKFSIKPNKILDQEHYNFLLEESSKGNSFAQKCLGNAYDCGYTPDGPKDCAKAIGYYEQSSVKGNPLALFNLGCAYYYGDTSEGQKDYVKAFEYFQQSAEKGYGVAFACLGDFYREGNTPDGKKNYKKAFENYKIAVAKGEIKALAALGDCYYHGQTPNRKKSYAKAIDYYKKSAEKGYARAFACLGDCYQLGHTADKKKDYAKAIEYYEQSAEKGYAPAFCALGDLYRLGCTCDGQKDYAKAIDYYEQAYENGFVDVLENLGDCYWNGQTGDGQFDITNAMYNYRIYFIKKNEEKDGFGNRSKFIDKISDLELDEFYLSENEISQFQYDKKWILNSNWIEEEIKSLEVEQVELIINDRLLDHDEKVAILAHLVIDKEDCNLEFLKPIITQNGSFFVQFATEIFQSDNRKLYEIGRNILKFIPESANEYFYARLALIEVPFNARLLRAMKISKVMDEREFLESPEGKQVYVEIYRSLKMQIRELLSIIANYEDCLAIDPEAYDEQTKAEIIRAKNDCNEKDAKYKIFQDVISNKRVKDGNTNTFDLLDQNPNKKPRI